MALFHSQTGLHTIKILRAYKHLLFLYSAGFILFGTDADFIKTCDAFDNDEEDEHELDFKRNGKVLGASLVPVNSLDCGRVPFELRTSHLSL